jgi:hypothetical protein
MLHAMKKSCLFLLLLIPLPLLAGAPKKPVQNKYAALWVSSPFTMPAPPPPTIEGPKEDPLAEWSLGGVTKFPEGYFVILINKKKSEEKAKKLAKARAALYKYHMNVHSLNDKDWGDLLRWVLPAAGVDFLVKDFKKKETIKAKLESLPQSWESYIPPGENAVVDAV